MSTKKQTELSEALHEQSMQIAAEARNKAELARHYTSEPKVSMAVSPLYRPYFGNVMKVSINGIAIFMPIDNSRHQIPQTFADEITRRIMAVDAIMKKQDRMSNIADNNETMPGELPLV